MDYSIIINQLIKRVITLEKKVADLEDFNEGLIQGIQERLKGSKT